MTTSFVVNFNLIQTISASLKPQKLVLTETLPQGYNLEITVTGGFENVYSLKFTQIPTNVNKGKVRISYPTVYFYRCLDYSIFNENGVWGTIFTLPNGFVERRVILTFTFYTN